MSIKPGEYEGRLLGKRRLDTLLGVRGNTAFYLTHGDGRDQLIELLPDDAASSATIASWDRTRDLSEVKLLSIHATGKADLEGSSVAYAVMELPQDDLGEMLSRRNLTETEERSIFSAVAATLHALHQRDLVHGAVTPSNIFMVGDEVRMSVDTLAPAGKPGKEQDLRQFAATLVVAQAPTSAARPSGEALLDGPAIARAAAQLPSPFKEIALGCLGGSSQGKWTAARIVQALSGGPPAAPPRARLRWPVLAGAGIGLLVAVFYLLMPSPPHPAPTSPPATAPAQVKGTVPAQAEVAPPTPEPLPAPAAAGAADRNLTRQKPAESWAVIAGTYANFDGARKHAEIYGKQLPQLQLRVFPPDGQGRHYFIVLGSGLTHDAAERLRRDVVGQGAPPDTYVTKIVE